MADTLVSFALIDDNDGRKTVNVFLPAATTQANIATFAASFAALLDAVTGLQIDGISYTIDVAIPGGLKTSPTADYEVERGAQFSFANASRYKWGHYAPGWLNELFVGDEIDLEGAGVAAYVNAFVDGLSGTNPTNGYAFDLTSLAASKKTHRK